MRALPGVTAVGFTPQLPLTGSGPLSPYAYDEATARNWESETADRRFVSPRLFAALGTRVLEGRVFDAHDRSQRLIVIDETLAAQVWPGQSAVGKRLQTQPNGSGPDLYSEVIGVVEHMRILDLTRAVRPQIFGPMYPSIGPSFYVVIRTDGQPAALANDARQSCARSIPASRSIACCR